MVRCWGRIWKSRTLLTLAESSRLYRATPTETSVSLHWYLAHRFLDDIACTSHPIEHQDTPVVASSNVHPWQQRDLPHWIHFQPLIIQNGSALGVNLSFGGFAEISFRIGLDFLLDTEAFPNASGHTGASHSWRIAIQTHNISTTCCPAHLFPYLGYTRHRPA